MEKLIADARGEFAFSEARRGQALACPPLLCGSDLLSEGVAIFPGLDPWLQVSFGNRAEELVALRARGSQHVQNRLPQMEQADEVSRTQYPR